MAENRLEGPAAREPLELVHHHPGRLRFRAASLVDGTAVADRIRQAMDGTPGVKRIAHSTRTGSLLVEYEPVLVDASVIVTRIANAAGLGEPLSPREARRRRRSPAQRTIDAAREINALTYELTGWRSDLRFLAPVALAGAAAYSLITNRPNSRIPRWDNLLYWSYNVFAALHQDEIDEAGAEAGLDRSTPDRSTNGSREE